MNHTANFNLNDDLKELCFLSNVMINYVLVMKIFSIIKIVNFADILYKL